MTPFGIRRRVKELLGRTLGDGPSTPRPYSPPPEPKPPIPAAGPVRAAAPPPAHDHDHDHGHTHDHSHAAAPAPVVVAPVEAPAPVVTAPVAATPAPVAAPTPVAAAPAPVAAAPVAAPEPAPVAPREPADDELPPVAGFGQALTEDAVQAVLDDMVRPALQADGGDITLVRIDGDDIVVRLVGSCSTCPSSIATMRMGVERLLQEEFPTMRQLLDVTDAPEFAA